MKPATITEQDKADIVSLYLNGGLSIRKISCAYKAGEVRVTRLLRQAGVPVQPGAALSDSNKAGIVQDYTVNGYDQHTLARVYETDEKRIRAILVAAGVDIHAVSNRMRSESQKRRRAA